MQYHPTHCLERFPRCRYHTAEEEDEEEKEEEEEVQEVRDDTAAVVLLVDSGAVALLDDARGVVLVDEALADEAVIFNCIHEAPVCQSQRERAIQRVEGGFILVI